MKVRLTPATLVLCLTLSSLGARAEDGGLVSDAPRAVRLDDGSVLFNQPAYTQLDAEMRRLQGVERLHRSENWVPVLLVGLAVGLVGGVVVGAVISKSVF